MKFLVLTVKMDKHTGEPLEKPVGHIVDTEKNELFAGAETETDVQEMIVALTDGDKTADKVLSVTCIQEQYTDASRLYNKVS